MADTLILGGTGIVGSALVLDLLKDNRKLRILYRSDFKKKELIQYLKADYQAFKEDDIEWIKGDILQISSLEKALVSIKTVYHCANFVSFNERHRQKLLEINHIGTQKVVNACIEKNVEALLYVSSIATLDPNLNSNIVNQNSHWNISDAHSSYQESKYLGELEVWRGASEGLQVVVVQPGVILSNYSFHQSSGKLFLAYDKKTAFYSSGSSGFIDVQDVVKRIIYVMQEKKYGQSFILVAENFSYHNVATTLRKVYQKSKPIYVSPQMLNFISIIYSGVTTIFPFLPRFSRAFWKSLQTKIHYESNAINAIYKEPYLDIKTQLITYGKDYINNE